MPSFAPKISRSSDASLPAPICIVLVLAITVGFFIVFSIALLESAVAKIYEQPGANSTSGD